jgi:hypothetical protein
MRYKTTGWQMLNEYRKSVTVLVLVFGISWADSAVGQTRLPIPDRGSPNAVIENAFSFPEDVELLRKKLNTLLPERSKIDWLDMFRDTGEFPSELQLTAEQRAEFRRLILERNRWFRDQIGPILKDFDTATKENKDSKRELARSTHAAQYKSTFTALIRLLSDEQSIVMHQKACHYALFRSPLAFMNETELAAELSISIDEARTISARMIDARKNISELQLMSRWNLLDAYVDAIPDGNLETIEKLTGLDRVRPNGR